LAFSFRVPDFLEQCSKFVPEKYRCILCGSSVVPIVPENTYFYGIYFFRGIFWNIDLWHFKLRKSLKFLELLEQSHTSRVTKAFLRSKRRIFSGTVFQVFWNTISFVVKRVVQ
jgi:hypothetical protein